MSITRPSCASIELAEDGARAGRAPRPCRARRHPSGASSRPRRRPGSAPGAAGCRSSLKDAGSRESAVSSSRHGKSRSSGDDARRMALTPKLGHAAETLRSVVEQAPGLQCTARVAMFPVSADAVASDSSPPSAFDWRPSRGQQADDSGRTSHVFRYPRPGRAPAARRSRTRATTPPRRSRRRPFPPCSPAATCMGGAQTGTGKTAGFALPLLQRLMAQARGARCARPAADPRPDPDADPRARRAGRGKRAHLRQAHASSPAW